MGSPRRAEGARTIDEPSGWGRYRSLSWRDIARRNPVYARSVATNQVSRQGMLAALALAIALGVVE